MHIQITLDQTVETPALIDSGAGGMFIDEQFARMHNIPLTPLISPIPVYNVDGTQNKQGAITHYTWRNLSVAGTTHRTRLLATSLGKETLILGLPWLRRTNAQINWQSGRIAFEDPIPVPTISKRPPATVEEVSEAPRDPTPCIATTSQFILEEVATEHIAEPELQVQDTGDME